MKKLLTIMVMALMLAGIFCACASAELKYVSIFVLDDQEMAGHPDDCYVNIKLVNSTIDVHSYTYTVDGISLDKSSGYVDAVSTGVDVLKKGNCEKHITVYVRYITGEPWPNDYGYEAYDLVPVHHELFTQISHTQEEGIYQCGHCDYTKTGKPIHDPETVITKTPTCSEDGAAAEICKECGKVITPEHAIKGAHSWVKVMEPAECIKDVPAYLWEYSHAYYKCERCGKYLVDYDGTMFSAGDSYDPNTKPIDSNEDDWVTDYAPAAGVWLDISDWRAYTNNPLFDGHDWENWHFVDADCVRAGYKVHWCLRCEKNEVRELDFEDYARDPDWYEANYYCLGPKWTVGLNVEGLTCQYKQAADYGYANGQAYVYCAICGGSKEGHLLKEFNTVYTDSFVPYFDGPVLQGEYKVTGDDLTAADLKSQAMSVPFKVEYTGASAINHDTVTVYANAAHVYNLNGGPARKYTTYTWSYGDKFDKTAGDISDVAGKTITVNGTHVPGYCVTYGFTDYFCIYDTVDIGIGGPIDDSKLEHPVKRVYDTKVTGHDWGEWVAEYEPDEIHLTGWYHHDCKRCLFAQKTHGTAAPCGPKDEDHTWTIKNAAAIKCGKNSNVTFVCIKCSQEKTEDYVRDHSYTVVISDVAATCKQDGVKVTACEFCGDLKSETIPFDGKHTVIPVPGKAATCKEAGLKDAYKCSVCGKLFSDEGKTEISAQEVIPVDENAHVWDEEILKDATCKETGIVLKTCSECGKVEKVVTDKLAHIPDEGTVTKEATKEAPGEKTYKCTVCGDELPELTEEIPYVVTADPWYTLSASYDGTTVTGKLEHVDDTLEADVKNIRVTFYIEGNYYMATMAEVAEDGTFSVDGVGPIVYITVAATANSSVTPDAYKKIAEPIEIYVK